MPSDLESKQCARCQQVKPCSEFGLDRSRRDQLTPWCLPCKNESGKEVRQKRRLRAIAALGGKCAECGYDKDPRALQFDHVNSDGCDHRRTGEGLGAAFENAIIRGEMAGRIQLLCANCNQIKMFDAEERSGRRVYERVIQTARTVRPHGRSTAASRARTSEVSKTLWDDPDRRAAMSLAGADGRYRPDIAEARRPQIEAKRAVAETRQRALAALVDERRPAERAAAALPQGSWSQFYERCLGCRETTRRHASDGCCTRCNAVIKGYGMRPRAPK